MLVSIAAGALIVSFLTTTRDIEIDPWITYETNYNLSPIHGGTVLTDYINLTSQRSSGIPAEIHTEELFEGAPLEDSEGITYYYHISDYTDELIPAVDTNFDGIPDFTIWGQDTNNGTTIIRRRILTDYDLVPGTYTYVVTIVPKGGS